MKLRDGKIFALDFVIGHSSLDRLARSSDQRTNRGITNFFKKYEFYLFTLLAQTVDGSQLPSAFFEEQITGGRHPADDKRYTIGMIVGLFRLYCCLIFVT